MLRIFLFFFMAAGMAVFIFVAWEGLPSTGTGDARHSQGQCARRVQHAACRLASQAR